MAGVDPPEPGDPVCSQPSLSSLHWSTSGHLESCTLSDLLRGRFKEHNIDDISLQSLWSFSPHRGGLKRDQSPVSVGTLGPRVAFLSLNPEHTVARRGRVCRHRGVPGAAQEQDPRLL